VRGTFTICRVASIPVDLQITWPPVFVFVSWTLAVRFFPALYPLWSPIGYWTAGTISSLLLFGSLLVHELAHAFVARRRGLVVYRVSLFCLGGMAEIDVDEGKASDEFWMALAGPAASVVLAAFCGIVWLEIARIESFLSAIALYLGISNALLAGFNILPGYPLDGGRILRSVLWQVSGDQAWATRWAGWLGQGIGGVGVVGGLVWLASGNVFAGFWLAAVGAFLVLAARGAIPSSLLSSS